jgi:hypothetical protein
LQTNTTIDTKHPNGTMQSSLKLKGAIQPHLSH